MVIGLRCPQRAGRRLKDKPPYWSQHFIAASITGNVAILAALRQNWTRIPQERSPPTAMISNRGKPQSAPMHTHNRHQCIPTIGWHVSLEEKPDLPLMTCQNLSSRVFRASVDEYGSLLLKRNLRVTWRVVHDSLGE